MARKLVGPTEYLGETMQGLAHPGLLLVSLDGRRRPNAMTIGWGSIGIYWGKPIFVVPVRESRYTYGCIAKTGDFTVNLLPRKLADVAAFCGTVSGREHDKFTEARLTAASAQRVKSPVIEECVLSYECKVVHVNDVLSKTLAKELARSCYPKGDYHRLYFGEILAVTADTGLRRKV
jgi:flavin reductase (DIM6/NTAB) family NADH-FMN oxidoreductase RutF